MIKEIPVLAIALLALIGCSKKEEVAAKEPDINEYECSVCETSRHNAFVMQSCSPYIPPMMASEWVFIIERDPENKSKVYLKCRLVIKEHRGEFTR